MQYAVVFAAMAGYVAAQGAPTTLAPPSTPSECSQTFEGDFQIGIMDLDTSSSKMKVKRQGLSPNDIPGNALELHIDNGLLMDQSGRYGYIAAGGQLQFDNPIQSGAEITTGFSICPNDTLALVSTIWYECLSGDPNSPDQMFGNLYDRSLGGQCTQINIGIVPDSESDETSSSSAASGGASASSSASTRSSGTAASTTGSASTSASSSTGTASTSGTASRSSSTTGTLSATSAGISGTGAPFNPNAASSVAFSGTFLALAAGAVGLGAILL